MRILSTPLRATSVLRFRLLIASFAMLLAAAEVFANPFVRLDYNLFTSRARGTVFIELFDDRPLTRDNFLAYVNGGKYDNSIMHRLVRNFVLQGGGFYPEIYGYPPVQPGNQQHPLYSYILPLEVDLDGNEATPNPTVDNEFNEPPGIRSNVAGTLAMAKVSGNPDSATSEWFFNVGNNGGTAPNGLDYQNGGFTVFAKVVGDGMNLINAYNGGLAILNLNYDSNGNKLADDGGVFGETPVLGSRSSYNPLVLLNADRVDYIGTGSPAINLNGGLVISTRDAFFDTGTTFSGSGEITIAPGRTLGVREAVLTQAGPPQVFDEPLKDRSLVNFGTFEPGLQIGRVRMNAFRQEAGATLEIQLNGSATDTGYDSIVTTAGILLGGDLNVSTFGYAPSAGNSYTILTAGTAIVGEFDDINLFKLSPGLVWNVSRTLTTYTLSVAAADFNRDGLVDSGDYVMWRKMRNPALAVTAYSGADGNGDGFVNDADYQVWRTNLGNNRGGSLGGGGSSSVPEPSSVALFLIGVGGLICRRHRAGSAR